MIHSLTLFLIFSSLITRSFGTKVIMDRALQSNKTDVLNRDSGNDNFNYFVDNEDHIKRNEQTHFISPIRTNLAKQIGYSSMMNFLLYMLTFVPLLFSLVRNFQPSPYGGRMMDLMINVQYKRNLIHSFIFSKASIIKLED